MNFTKDQKRIIEAQNCDLLVSAAAGSGKTAVLVERIIQMISDSEQPLDIDRILVVTFTKAAAAQMKEKIVKALEEKLQDNPKNEHFVRQINYINHASILTIDSFCYQVVKENFYILGIDPGIRIGDAGEMGLLKQEVLESVMEEFYKSNPDFVAFSDVFSADKNDEKIEDYIQKIYDVSASYPRPFLWTQSARQELAPEDETGFCNLSHVRDYISEIHSSASGIRERIILTLEKVRSTDGPIYMEKAFLSDLELIDSIMSAKTYSHFSDLLPLKFSNIGRGKKGTYDEDLALQLKKVRDDYKSEIKNLIGTFELPIDTVLVQMKEQSAMLIALLDIVDCFREKFLNAKLERNVLEFSDVEHFALQVLCEDYDEAGNPIPSQVAKELSEQFYEILIDEYQDSNYLQEDILCCVSKHHEGINNMFMVGDVKQSIYSFRMARPDLFMHKYHTYQNEENAKCRKLLLKNNFRSRENVLECINYMFYQLMGEDLGGIEYTEDEALVPGRSFIGDVDDSVEILIGESKDFDFLNCEDAQMTAEKQENLDEDLEDIGRMELEASMIAKRILEMTGKDEESHFMVTEETSTRPVSYGDIVLLLRAPAAFAGIFSETLMSQGIPVIVQNEKGYFDTVEIRTVLSLLKVLDNPLNEVELAAVLRSYFCGLTSDELALLILIKRREKDDEKKGKQYSLFEVVKKLSNGIDEDRKEFVKKQLSAFPEYGHMLCERLIPKCKKLYVLFTTLENMKNNQKVSDLIAYIYSKTGYDSYVSVMPEGKRRLRNLNLFLAEADEYEKKTFGSLFAFLTYVDKLERKEITLGGDPMDNCAYDAVRIMSIHKSKGLEFPVVFLAGIGKRFNLTDTKTPLIIHSDYHLGAKYRNMEKRCGNESFSRKAMAARMLTENIAEELRIFYVGLTRAKDKLILTGVTPDIVSQVKKYENVASRKELKLSYSIVHTARCYMDFVVMSMMRSPSFCQAMKQVRKRMDKNGEHILSAEYDNRYPINEPYCKILVQVYDFRNLLVQHLKTDTQNYIDRCSVLNEWSKAPERNKEEVCRVLSWKYKEQAMAEQKSKLSVTEIKRIYEVDFEAPDILNKDYETLKEYIPALPEFIAGKQPLNAAERGTWIHKTMELFDFKNIRTKQQVQQALDVMWQEGRIIEEAKEFITVDMIWNFIDQEFGRRMCKAARDGRLYKEKQFIIGVPISRLLSVTQTKSLKEKGSIEDFNGKPIVVQGIIDAYFKEEDKLILLDYKTDNVKTGQETVLKKRYDTQLRYYKETLEQLTGLEVSETYIYSFALNKAIRLF